MAAYDNCYTRDREKETIQFLDTLTAKLFVPFMANS